MAAPKSTRKTFNIRTLTSERRKKLKQDTDVRLVCIALVSTDMQTTRHMQVVITLGPLSSDGDSVMSEHMAIPWKILTFQANSEIVLALELDLSG